tara:strand:+ start:921 stop:1121 length:201 start_codon:yes stop_codon:yes gene_type:complete
MKTKNTNTTTSRSFKITVEVAACPFLTTDEDTTETLKNHFEEALSYCDKLHQTSKVLFQEGKTVYK